MSAIKSIFTTARPSIRTTLRRPAPRPALLPTAPLRTLHRDAPARTAATAVADAVPDPRGPLQPVPPQNTPLSFPCLDAIESRTEVLTKRSLSGPEPSYTTGFHETFHSPDPILLDWGGVLPSFDIAYETWGSLNADRSNAILLHTGLSASSHAHSTGANPKPGWWERFIGPGAPLDTDKYFVICTNVLGGCYGSTGPSSVDPLAADPKTRYGTRFPILTMQDMVRAQFRLLDGFRIDRLYASVGSSMGGMQSLAAGVLERDRVGRIVSVSGCARSHPYSIAMRHTQRQVLMNDPAWSSTRGNYYTSIPPHTGMKLARQIATITYRSGPEWEQRFGRRRADPSKPPALCPDFLIETYLDHAGEKWCLEYDANSLLYVSKAMDLFDLGREHMDALARQRLDNAHRLGPARSQTADDDDVAALCNLTLPERPYEEAESSADALAAPLSAHAAAPSLSEPPHDLVKGLRPLADTPTLVLGVASDILFPAWQQREIAETLRRTGNRRVTHVELGEDRSLFGHDTFLLDLEGVGGEIKRFLE
ncbi:Serine O-succinyltransferase [Elasticomyces elasticus]|nr:Serine O-succinyltransferase [Elasticomyces elasticus]